MMTAKILTKEDLANCVLYIALLLASLYLYQLLYCVPRFNLLLEAVKEGRIADVQKAIREGAAVNGIDNYGYTPLHRAALSARARGSLQPSAAPRARGCSRTARGSAD